MAASLPTASPDGQAHSDRVRRHIAQRIVAEGGWIPFSTYMDLALHAPGLGYYAAGATKFGAGGDFVTAPEISPLFGEAITAQLAQALRATGGDVLELGAGTGRLAGHVLNRLAALQALPANYFILEPSAELAARQRTHLAERANEHAARVQWLNALPARFAGVIFGNEVLDAIPCEIVAHRHGEWSRRGVEVRDDDAFGWRDVALGESALFAAARARFPPGDYVSEINFQAEALVATLAGTLERGALLFLDYGFPASEYYHPQRNEGTLMCHYRQHAHDDPFFLPGLQDITAHVDFSAVARAGVGGGLDLAGYTTQAHFLMNCGILDLLGAVPPENAIAYLPRANAVQRLLSPAEMGELFKVIALTRGIDDELIGFCRGDQQRRL